MSVYLFPGQGSQTKGMGAAVFKAFPEVIAIANDILGYSIVELSDDNERLNQTQYTQPALYVVNALTYYQKIEETHQKPQFAAGHSLGEYNALLAADVFDFETGLALVKKRGELMSQATGGSMAAIIGLRVEDIHSILKQENLPNISIANYNSYTQIVISGPANTIAVAQPIFEKAGADLFVPLKVSGAFHSPHMQAAKQSFKDFLNQFQFNNPSIPVIANINAKPYQPHAIASSLAEQITSPVLWTTTIEYLLGQGETEFMEIGEGTVLTGLMRRIKNGQ